MINIRENTIVRINNTWTLWPCQSLKFLYYRVRREEDSPALSLYERPLYYADSSHRPLIDWKTVLHHLLAFRYQALHLIKQNYSHRNYIVSKNVICIMLCIPILSKSSPPAAYSRKIYSISFCRRVPKYLRMCECCNIFWIHTSFFTDADASGCFRVSTIFMATASPVCRFSNSLTLMENWQWMEMLIRKNCTQKKWRIKK